jgi:hypothetical protein
MLKGKGHLTPLQQDFLAAFSQIPDQSSFYLTGGTALAEYYLGHRLSFDLDLFTAEAELVLPISYIIQEKCAINDLRISVSRRFVSYVEFILSRGDEQLKVDLALDSPFRFDPPLETDLGVWVNDFQDLRIDKLLAYYGRVEPRDAVDLYFIFQRNSINELLKLAEQKDPGFDLYWFAVSLNRAEDFPDEIERWPVKMLQAVNVLDLKRDFINLAQKLMGNFTRDV